MANSLDGQIREALRHGPLGDHEGKKNVQRRIDLIVRRRLLPALLEAGRTLDALLSRYHLPLQETVNLASDIAREWYRDRSLRSDPDWVAAEARVSETPRGQAIWRKFWSSKPPVAPWLRAAVDALRTAGDLVRDMHVPLAQRFDEAMVSHRSHGHSADEAWEAVLETTVRTSRLRLDAGMDEAAVRQRVADAPDELFTVGEDADLFAASSTQPVDGTTLAQFAVVMLRFAEVQIRGRQLQTKSGAPPLAAGRAAARAIAAYLQRECGRPLYPHAGALLVAACPSPSLHRWREKAIERAWYEQKIAERSKRPPESPRDLPDAAYRSYARYLGDRVRILLR